MTAIMIHPRKPIDDDLRSFPERWIQGGAICISTHALYPTGSNVVVEITPDVGGTWIVSDGSNGYETLREQILEWLPRAASRRAKTVEDATGVRYSDGTWKLDKVLQDRLPSAIMWVANASQTWVSKMMSEAQKGASEALEALLKDRLYEVFGPSNVEVEGSLIGRSTKLYKFTALAHYGKGKIAAFEAVTPHGAAVNSAYTKLDDVRHKDDAPNYIEAVISSEARWNAADIVLLRSAATSVRNIEQNFDEHLRKIAAL